VSTYLAALIGYLIGGIPTGIWLSKFLAGKDPREVGSGSSGATNVSRVLGKKWGVVVLLLDALKGFAPVFWLTPLIFRENVIDAQIIVAVSAVMGHVFTPFARFKGGKGVATAAGAMAAINASALGYALIVWVIVFASTRKISPASLAAAVSFPVFAMLGTKTQPMIVIAGGVAIAGFLFYTHRQNITRLLNGTEPRFF